MFSSRKSSDGIKFDDAESFEEALNKLNREYPETVKAPYNILRLWADKIFEFTNINVDEKILGEEQ